MIRGLVGTVGLAVGGYGGWLLLTRLDRDQLVAAGTWLVAGPPLHDFVLTVVLLGVVAAGRRLLPEPARAPALVAMIVFGSLTLAVLPILGGFGDVPEESGILARPYGRTWLVLAAVTVAAVIATSVWRSRHRRAGDDG